MANQPLLRNWPPMLPSTDFGEIMQNNGHYAVQGHSRLPILVGPTNRKPMYDFLLVINT